MTKTDPGAFFREMLGQWEGIASQFGAEMMKSGATTAGPKARDAAKEAMSRALEAANMPSREDMIDMTARMRGIEVRLERIETLLEKLAQAAKPDSDGSKSKRSKKPPKD